jgi:hypothetical protein
LNQWSTRAMDAWPRSVGRAETDASFTDASTGIR